ncbi:conserved hypothetical protein [Hyella patelloides LEGE 07179]|uniref:Uncharacterized protein n=1 Tax=Hyella patelloides LEGE 07179 TaxID=945734 RepID=A0A563VSB2_9CYAN|nr:hypothetical protein [Hyella patelloides]VEP14179.1 conserved hypothetical protein [Hyella patelloides LEGE 07179]
MNQKLLAQDIKPLLDSLIVEAETVDKALASRLRQIKTWIKNTKPGSLSKKREVIFFLRELIEDVEIWLALKELDPTNRQLALKELTPTERYWFTELFPQWFQKFDPKLSIWKKELMAGKFESKDRRVLNILSDIVKKRGGSVSIRYICDFSMATDLIVSGTFEKPLCVQLTITNEYLLDDKKSKWKDTLKHWNIERAIFISYHPVSKTGSELDVIHRLANQILNNANTLPNTCYIEDTVE